MKKAYLIILIIVILVFLRFFIAGSKDSWVRDERGVWIKHGTPSKIPDYVKEQQEIINSALDLYGQKKAEGMNFSSQCLGSIGNYAVDIVSVPRTQEDNLAENQCQDYKKGKVSNFIELDKEGNVVRIV